MSVIAKVACRRGGAGLWACPALQVGIALSLSTEHSCYPSANQGATTEAKEQEDATPSRPASKDSKFFLSIAFQV